MQKIFLLSLLLFGSQWIQAQENTLKGNLPLGIKSQGITSFESDAPIYTLIFSTSRLDLVQLNCALGQPLPDDKFDFPVRSFKKHPKVPSCMVFKDKYFYLLAISPKPYPIEHETYFRFATYLSEAKNELKKDIIELNYSSKYPDIQGTIAISFKNGAGPFQLDMKKLTEILSQIEGKEKELIPLLKDSIELAAYQQRTIADLQTSENILSASRNDHNKLSAEEISMLDELITLTDSVGFALNKAFISNNVEEARKVADITGALEKRKTALKEDPIYKRIELTYQNDYRLSANRFSHARMLGQIEQKQAENQHKINAIRKEIAPLKVKKKG